MTITELMQAVRDLDDVDLDILAQRVREELRSRRGVTARIETGQLRVGSRARFNERVNPRYLIGTEFTVTKINTKSVGGRLDADADPRAIARFGGGTIRIPRVICEPVPSEVQA